MTRRPFLWEKSYTADLKWDLDVQPSTIISLFMEATDRFQNRPALNFRGRELSFTDLRQRAQRAADAFLSLGIGKTRPLALYLPNVPYHPVAFFGGLMTGAPIVHLSPLDAERELAHKIQDSGARTVFTTDFINMLPLALKLLDRGLVDHLIVGEDGEWGRGDIPLAPIPERSGVIPFKVLMDKAGGPAALPAVSPGDIALLQYTGGTTGLPKGAVLTHRNLFASVASYQAS